MCIILKRICASVMIGSTKMASKIALAYLMPKRRMPPWGLVALGWRVYNIEKDVCRRGDW